MPAADFFVVTAMTAKDPGEPKAFPLSWYTKGTLGLSVGNHENKMGIRCSTTSDVILGGCENSGREPSG